MSYNTKQKDLILDVIKKYKGEFEIKDIYEKSNRKVGLTTIYRFIDKLVIDGFIKKHIDDNNITHYQYFEKCNSDNHFYLKCNKCKKVEHVDCDCINELYNHINSEHSFRLNKENIIIKGLCKNCNKEEKELC